MGWLDWLRRSSAEDSWTREWRTDWAAAVEHPDAATAAALRARLDAAGPDQERFEIEHEMIPVSQDHDATGEWLVVVEADDDGVDGRIRWIGPDGSTGVVSGSYRTAAW